MDNTSKKLADIGSWMIEEALAQGRYFINSQEQLVLSSAVGFKPAELAAFSRRMKNKRIGERILKQGPYSLPITRK